MVAVELPTDFVVDETDLADAIEITTYSALGAVIDTAYAFTAAGASTAARALLEDAALAGHEQRELTVVFKCRGAEPLVLGRDVATERRAA